MSDDAGYVHEPSIASGGASRDGGDAGSGAEHEATDGASGPIHPDAADREFGRRGWVLVSMVLVAFVVAPALILLIPPGAEGYRFALLIVPLVPAVLLASTAVWATTRP